MADSAKEEKANPLDLSWKEWCRLCAKIDGMQKKSVFIRGVDMRSDSTTLCTAIGRYFWVNMRETDPYPKYLCSECYELVEGLMDFNEYVDKVQNMYSLLANTHKPLGLGKVRDTFGLSGETPKPKLPLQRLKEESPHEDDGDPHEVNAELDKQEEVADDNRKTVDDDRNVDESQEELELAYEHGTDMHQAPSEVEDSNIFRELEYKEATGGDDVACLDKSIENEVIYSDVGQGEGVNAGLEGEIAEFYIEEVPHEIPEQGSSSLKRPRGRPKRIITHKVSKRLKADNQNQSSNGSDQQSEPSDYLECLVCGKIYRHPTSYRKHMLRTHNVAPDIPDFECSKCQKTFPTERQLQVHTRSHLPLNEKLDVPCPCCERKFTTTVTMQQHIRCVHNNEKMYVCDECGRELKTSSALKDHKMIHKSECPFECPHCEKRFKTKSRLRIHIDTHQETVYPCDVCGMKLNTQRTLKAHLSVHDESKRFKCDFCDSEFKRSKALKNHLILHTGLRPYVCNFCGKAFANGSNCRSHKKKLHPKEVAEEDALGKKSEATQIPKIDDLKRDLPRMAVRKPRVINRSPGGLPARVRDLLIKDEARKKQHQQYEGEATEIEVQTEDEQYEDCIFEVVDCPGEDSEDEEEETVIYEIINEM